MCYDEYVDYNEPYNKQLCPDCSSDTFNVTVNITSQGKEDFEEECVESCDGFTNEDWVNGFESIAIGIRCCGCDYEADDWAVIECM